jgi:hypothetical protein
MVQCKWTAAQHSAVHRTADKFSDPHKGALKAIRYEAAVESISRDKPPALLAYDRSARRDARFYLLAAVGLVFAYAGATIDPASNCSEGGECAPWLVPVAFIMGVAAVLAGIGMLWANPRWGCRVDVSTRMLVWWNDNLAPGEHRIPLDLIGTVRVRYGIDERDIFLFDRQGQPISFPRDEVTPYTRREDWARALAALAPHIKVEVIGA